MDKSKLDKYLATAARRQFEGVVGRRFAQAVVIPACDELEFLGQTLGSLAAMPAADLELTLVLVVVNNPAPAFAAPGATLANQTLLAWLRQGRFATANLNLAWLDASSVGLETPGKGGVGEARKIGMDSALPLLDFAADPLLLSLDADTVVEKNYVRAIRAAFALTPSAPGVTVGFAHQPGATAAEDLAITLLELTLRHYVGSLRQALSPYGHHSIGSAMAARAEAYVKAGGMRRNSGGEDFYFLQALRKLGPLPEANATTVHPSARPSGRVPFGTGPKVRGLLDGKPPLVYHPAAFAALRQLLSEARRQIADGGVPMSRPARAYLESLGFPAVWEGIRRNNPPEKLQWAFDCWFDGFRTLKFIHFLEEAQPGDYPRVEVLEACRLLFGTASADPRLLLAAAREAQR